MAAQHKVLLLDDDQDVLELYREILSQLPTKPEIHTATSGARAIALLESEPFTLLISDLCMPKMDGLQVLTIVRRKFPHLRTIVLTAVVDEQYRARAYAMGIDLFLEKPNNSKEISFFLDCIESLLGKQETGGFRGVQSKSLVDIIQLECLSQSSSVLKITNGPNEGRIWIVNGEVIDAACEGLSGEAAFQKILAWKTGNFEIQPAEPGRTRTIFNSAQGLLLETAQALDEAQAQSADESPAAVASGKASRLAEMARIDGLESLVTVSVADKSKFEAWGLEHGEQGKDWVFQTMNRLQSLGEKLHAGSLNGVEGSGLQRKMALAVKGESFLCAGFKRNFGTEEMRQSMRKILSQWAS